MSVKSADTLSDVSDHFNGNIEQPCSLHYDYKLINKLTYNHWDCLSACQIESKFILLKKAKFTNYNLPNNALDHDYSLDFAKPFLYDIGAMAYEYRQRLSMHPGQYNQIGAVSEDIFQKTILELRCHADILDIIEEDLDFDENKGIICIHGGGVYGDKDKTIERWCSNFRRLPENVRNRIAIENCEKCYSVQDCLKISKKLNIPVIFDIHHYECYNMLHPSEDILPLKKVIKKVFKTWHKRGLKPYCHISEQGKGKTGHHSDYISKIPDCFLNAGREFTLDVEAKMKENAIFKLVNYHK